MKKFTQTTLIALLIGTFVFAQKGSPGNQAAPSQTTVIVGALRGSVILLSPADGKSIAASDASKPVLFRWTAIVPKPKEVLTYRLKVWQLMQGQSGLEAMRSNQPIVTKDVVNVTQAAISNLYTGPCKPPYLCDFIWAVEVLNSEGFSIGNNYAVNSSFKFDNENPEAGIPKGGNKGNAGNSGMPTGKSTNAQGDPVHGVDVKLGVKSVAKQGCPVHDVYVKGGVKSTRKVDKELDKRLYSTAGKNDCCLNPCCSENAIIDKNADKDLNQEKQVESPNSTKATSWDTKELKKV